MLGHIQRGGSPTAHDRVLASRFGVHACDMVARGEFGKMAALRGNEMTSIPLADATRELKRVPAEYFDVAQRLLRLTTGAERRDVSRREVSAPRGVRHLVTRVRLSGCPLAGAPWGCQTPRYRSQSD